MLFVGAVGVVESVSIEYNWLDQVQPHGPSSHYALGPPNKRSLHASKQIDSSYSAVVVARGSNDKNNSTERSVFIGWRGIDHGLAQSLQARSRTAYISHSGDLCAADWCWFVLGVEQTNSVCS